MSVRAELGLSLGGREPGWTVEVHSDDHGLHRLGPEWDDLVDRCGAATPFQSHAWLSSWWQAYREPGRLRLVLVRRSGRLVAAAPMMLRRRRACPVLVPLGGSLCDFTDVLVDGSAGPDVGDALAAALVSVPGWRVIDLPEVRPGGAAMNALLPAWPGNRYAVDASVCLEVPATDLPTFLANLPKKVRKVTRRRRNQISRLGVDVRRVGGPEAGRAVGDLLRLHAWQWQGRAVNSEHLSERFAAHLTAAAASMIPSGQAEIVEYRVGDRHVASQLLYVGGGITGMYLYGAEPELLEHIDLNTLLLSTTLPIAVRYRSVTVSMLRGAEPYKRRWRPREQVNQRLLLVRPGSRRGTGYGAAIRARRTGLLFLRNHVPWLRLPPRIGTT